MDQTEVTAGSIQVHGGRRRGRPVVAEPSIRVSAWVPLSTAERLMALASKHDESLSKVVRQACDHLAKRLTP